MYVCIRRPVSFDFHLNKFSILERQVLFVNIDFRTVMPFSSVVVLAEDHAASGVARVADFR